MSSKPISWSYSDIKYETVCSVLDLNYQVLQDFISKRLEAALLYGVLPIIVNPYLYRDAKLLSISSQIDITADTNPQALLNHLELSYIAYDYLYWSDILKEVRGRDKDYGRSAYYVFRYRRLSIKHLDYVTVTKRSNSEPKKTRQSNQNLTFYHPVELPLTYNKSKYGVQTPWPQVKATQRGFDLRSWRVWTIQIVQ